MASWGRVHPSRSATASKSLSFSCWRWPSSPWILSLIHSYPCCKQDTNTCTVWIFWTQGTQRKGLFIVHLLLQKTNTLLTDSYKKGMEQKAPQAQFQLQYHSMHVCVCVWGGSVDLIKTQNLKKESWKSHWLPNTYFLHHYTKKFFKTCKMWFAGFFYFIKFTKCYIEGNRWTNLSELFTIPEEMLVIFTIHHSYDCDCVTK